MTRRHSESAETADSVLIITGGACSLIGSTSARLINRTSARESRDAPPFGYIDVRGQNASFDVEIARWVARYTFGPRTASAICCSSRIRVEGFAWRPFGVSPRRTRTTGLLRRPKFAATTASTCSRRSQSEGAGWCEASSAARRAARSSCRAARRPRTPTARRRGRCRSVARPLPISSDPSSFHRGWWQSSTPGRRSTTAVRSRFLPCRRSLRSRRTSSPVVRSPARYAAGGDSQRRGATACSSFVKRRPARGAWSYGAPGESHQRGSRNRCPRPAARRGSRCPRTRADRRIVVEHVDEVVSRQPGSLLRSDPWATSALAAGGERSRFAGLFL
jgi:hypothetical protein